MTLALDTSALLALAIDGRERGVVVDALDETAGGRGGRAAGDPVWSASALALTEALPAIDRLTDDTILRLDLEDAVRLVWDHLHVVPVDQTCLDRAAALARAQPVRLTDAIHLAAAERLPPPVRFVTFDPAQIGVAIGLGLDVVST
jgi:predicted nucleic acid-binding protein